MTKVSIGSDPEFVVLDSKGVPVSAPKALGFTDSEVTIRQNETRFGNIFPDNANVEMSVNYGLTKKEFVDNLRGCLTIAHNLIGPERTLHAIPSLDYPEAELTHPICKVFGCDPDYDAFTVKVNKINKGAVKKAFRTAGGHIHIGNVEGNDFLQEFDSQLETVRTFELVAGIPALLLDHTKESLQRRSLYGGAGAHRVKPYGVECRSLSNFWTQTPELAAYVYDLSVLTAKEMREKNLKIDMTKLPNVINKGNLEAARNINKELIDVYPEIHAGFQTVETMVNMDKKIPLHKTWEISREV